MLSEYDLSCGHVQKEKLTYDHLFETTIELYKEHNAYHVRCFQRVKGSSSVDRIAWETFDSLNDAKVCYKLLSKTIRGK